MSQGFIDYLSNAGSPVRHLPHVEDVILNDANGIYIAAIILEQVGNLLMGDPCQVNISVKWDGSPSVVFGPHPTTHDFFVSTKAAFNKTNPRFASTHAHVDELFPGTVNRIMHVVLDELEVLAPVVPMQCDLLYTSDMVRQETLDGIEYLTFQPNTIRYAVDISSPTGQRMQDAAVGIALHTFFGLDLCNACPMNRTMIASLRYSPRVHVIDATYTILDGARFNQEQRADYTMAVDDVRHWLERFDKSIYNVILLDPMKRYLQQYVNWCVRNDRTPTTNDFALYLMTTADAEADARATENGKTRVRERFTNMLRTVEEYRRAFTTMFTLHNRLAVAKVLMVRALAPATDIKTFLAADDGTLQVTGPEGFVVTTPSGFSVKLVDRAEFSRRNFERWR